tara:strand:+ start:148 stop:552 length:405 start_codon:yes stop_codon:yes gene_type:complete
MKIIDMVRIATGENGTFGVLLDEGMPFAVTLEPEWKDNQKNISCIPSGEYICNDTNSVRFGYTFQIDQVPDRTHILFHCGNFTKDTKGCILIGEQFENDCILASRHGFKEFIYRLKGCGTFMLKITEHNIKGAE